jgi:hypothetical protein
MKLKEIYCEVRSTPYLEDPQRNTVPCIYAINAKNSGIVLMASAGSNNLYLALRGIFHSLGFANEYRVVDKQTDLNEYFGNRISLYSHTVASPYSTKSLVFLYKGKPVGDRFFATAGEQDLTTQDLLELVQALTAAKYMGEGLQLSVHAKVNELEQEVSSNKVVSSSQVGESFENQLAKASQYIAAGPMLFQAASNELPAASVVSGVPQYNK